MTPSKYGKKPDIFHGYVMVLIGFMTLTIIWGAIYSFGVFLKALSADFGWTRAMTSGSYSIFMLAYGLMGMIAGRLSDRFGTRIVITTCGFILGLGYLLMSQITSLWQLYLLYGVFIAAGLSGGMVPLTSTVARWFVKRRGLMTGILLSGFGAAVMVGPLTAEWLISGHGWRTSYLIIGIVTFVLITLFAQFLKRDPEKLGYLPYGESEIKPESIVINTPQLSPLGAIHTLQFWMLFLTALFWGIILNTTLVHLVPHITDLGISATAAANVLAIIGGVNIAGRLIICSFTDRIGNKPALLIGLVFVSFSLLSLQLVKDMLAFNLFAIAFGFGYGVTGTLIPLMVAELFGTRTHGATLGIIVFSFSIGGVVGPVLGGHIFDITNSYLAAFLATALLSITSLLLVSFLKTLSERN